MEKITILMDLNPPEKGTCPSCGAKPWSGGKCTSCGTDSGTSSQKASNRKRAKEKTPPNLQDLNFPY